MATRAEKHRRKFGKKRWACFIGFLAAGAVILILATAAHSQSNLDVVFKIDESGSMWDDIADVKANVITIFNALPAGSYVGLVGYGTSQHGGGSGQIPHVHTALTDNPSVFQIAVNELVASGGLEQGYRAVYEAATDTVYGGSLGFTPGAPYCNILITDETPNQGGNTRDQAIAAMNSCGGIFFGILPSSLFAEAQPLADATGGQLFDLAQFRADPTMIIEGVLSACVEAAQPVKVDIRPSSCPNPFKLKQKGVIPAAILGTETFDVTSIKPETVKLEGDCAALRWSIEDVATPYENGFSDPPLESECTTAGADGWPDLTVKFDSRCVAETQVPVTKPTVRLWTITGTYVNVNGNEVEFTAKDVVRVMP